MKTTSNAGLELTWHRMAIAGADTVVQRTAWGEHDRLNEVSVRKSDPGTA